MQKFLAFILLLSSIFYGYFYGYDNNKVIDKLNPGIEQTEITSDKVSIEIEEEIKTTTGSFDIKIVNHTGKFYQFRGEPDIEVLTKDGWYDVAKASFINAGEIKGSIKKNETITVTAKGINTYNIKKGYTYRLIMQFDDTLGEVVTAEARFNVTR